MYENEANAHQAAKSEQESSDSTLRSICKLAPPSFTPTYSTWTHSPVSATWWSICFKFFSCPLVINLPRYYLVVLVIGITFLYYLFLPLSPSFSLLPPRSLLQIEPSLLQIEPSLLQIEPSLLQIEPSLTQTSTSSSSASPSSPLSPHILSIT